MTTPDASDPEFPQLRLEFLEHIRATHAAHRFERDPRNLCTVLGINLVHAKSNFYTCFEGIPLIHYDPTQPTSRLYFTLWHEVSHHLFQTADEGFQALLEEQSGRNTNLSIALEEQLCYEAAGILLMPDTHLSEALDIHGLSPQGAVHLVETCGASREAALRRITDAFDIDTWSLLMKRDGFIIFSYTRTRYPLPSGFIIDSGHPIHQTFDGNGIFERHVRMPYRANHTRVPHRNMRAVAHHDFVLALFADSFPSQKSEHQPFLF